MATTQLPEGLEEVEAGRFVGARVERKEDPRFLTGRGRYTDDVVLPGMLHAAFVRSPHARAAITGVDAGDARALPGVLAVYTYDDVATVGAPDALDAGPLGARPLARGTACFVGDPVVLVVAESRAVAEDACELVTVDYDARPAVVDLWAAVDESDGARPRGARVQRRPQYHLTRRSRARGGVRHCRARGHRDHQAAPLHRGSDGDAAARSRAGIPRVAR